MVGVSVVCPELPVTPPNSNTPAATASPVPRRDLTIPPKRIRSTLNLRSPNYPIRYTAVFL